MRLVVCVALAALSSPTLCQELVRNGDFSNQLNGWTGSGPDMLLGSKGLTSFDVNAQGSSPCFGIRPGGNTYAPPHAPYKLLTQVTPLVPGSTYEIGIDIATVASTNNKQGGIIEVWLAGKRVATWTRLSGNISAGSYKDRLCGQFKYAGTAGTQALEVHLSRPLFIWTSGTPQLFIDNVSLRPTVGPTILHFGERKIGTHMLLGVQGRPSAAVLVMFAAKPAPPIPIPGIGGALKLDPASLTLLLSGKLDAFGFLGVGFPLPNTPALHGLPIWWQGLQADKNGAAFGGTYNVAVY